MANAYSYEKLLILFCYLKLLQICHVYKWGGKGEILIHDYLTRFTDLNWHNIGEQELGGCKQNERWM